MKLKTLRDNEFLSMISSDNINSDLCHTLWINSMYEIIRAMNASVACNLVTQHLVWKSSVYRFI